MPDNDKNSITPIGFHNYRGNHEVKFGIKLDDRRRHVYVIGKTGVGKSTLLENMAIHDIQSGKGMAFIDPHGESAELLLDFIPEERLDDVIYFDPSDMEHPIAFNPMEQVGTEYRHLVASGLMGVFKKIWVDAWSARMQYILNNTLLALLEFPDATLLGVLRMFADQNYRKKIVENLQDPVVKAFWQMEFAKYTQRLETEALASIQNKVGQLVSNPLVRNIFGQPRSALNMRDIMDSGKILIVNLSKGKIGEDNSSLLGAMMITRLQLAAMSRVDIPEARRRDFFLHVDEFQNFATESFANILSEARKYRLSLTLAHQYIGQLIAADGGTKVRDAVFGNVGTIITFRVGATDAEFLENEFMPEFVQNDLVNLAKANIYVKLMIDGVASRPFSAVTMTKQKVPLQNYRDIIIRNSQEHYGTPRKTVEAKIAGEWEVGNETILEERISRRNEKRLSELLRPNAAPPKQPSSVAPRATSGNKQSILPPTKFFAGAIDANGNENGDESDTLNGGENGNEGIEREVPKEMIGPPAPKNPKHVPKADVDIEELRKAITASLMKQAEPGEAATEEESEFKEGRRVLPFEKVSQEKPGPDRGEPHDHPRPVAEFRPKPQPQPQSQPRQNFEPRQPQPSQPHIQSRPQPQPDSTQPRERLQQQEKPQSAHGPSKAAERLHGAMKEVVKKQE